MKITKKLISLLLCIVLVVALSISASATVLFEVGDYMLEPIENNTQYEIDSYKGTSPTVNPIPSFNGKPLTSVGSFAFLNNTTMTKFITPRALTKFQTQAFFKATALKEVSLIPQFSSFDYGTFIGCESLTTINLEDTVVTNIPDMCFYNCDSLEEITLPSTVTSIGDQAFSYMDKLSKITIPESVTTIHDKAFYVTPNVVIYCYEDSAAHNFAKSKGIKFELLGSYILGDADNDGRITIIDATYIQRLLALLIEDPDGKIAVRGDVDRDVLSILDATYIQRYLAMYDVPADIGEVFYY